MGENVFLCRRRSFIRKDMDFCLMRSVKYGFEVLYTARALVRLELILVQLMIMYMLIRISSLHNMQDLIECSISSL